MSSYTSIKDIGSLPNDAYIGKNNFVVVLINTHFLYFRLNCNSTTN